MFHRTQRLERLRSIKIVNTLREKAMCKVCLEKEAPEGQRGANTTRSWFCHWVKSVGQENGSTSPATPQSAFLVIISCYPIGKTPCWLAGRWVPQLQADEGRPAPCRPYQGQFQAAGTLTSLMGSPGSCHHPSSFGVLSHCLISLMPVPWPWFSASLTWGLSLTFHLLASHLHPGGSSAEPEAS